MDSRFNCFSVSSNWPGCRAAYTLILASRSTGVPAGMRMVTGPTFKTESVPVTFMVAKPVAFFRPEQLLEPHPERHPYGPSPRDRR